VNQPNPHYLLQLAPKAAQAEDDGAEQSARVEAMDFLLDLRCAVLRIRRHSPYAIQLACTLRMRQAFPGSDLSLSYAVILGWWVCVCAPGRSC
jgi:hypothetical protein